MLDPMTLPKVEDKEFDDPDLEKLIDQIRERQWARIDRLQGLTPGDMAFALMRQIPREKWNTPLTELGHWPRGSTIAEVKANPLLKNFTPAQAILRLFSLDDELKRQQGKPIEGAKEPLP